MDAGGQAAGAGVRVGWIIAQVRVKGLKSVVTLGSSLLLLPFSPSAPLFHSSQVNGLFTPTEPDFQRFLAEARGRGDTSVTLSFSKVKERRALFRAGRYSPRLSRSGGWTKGAGASPTTTTTGVCRRVSQMGRRVNRRCMKAPPPKVPLIAQRRWRWRRRRWRQRQQKRLLLRRRQRQQRQRRCRRRKVRPAVRPVGPHLRRLRLSWRTLSTSGAWDPWERRSAEYSAGTRPPPPRPQNKRFTPSK